MPEQQIDRKDLKIQALRERLANLTVEHEDRAADYRVEITILSSRVEELSRENAQFKAHLDSYNSEEKSNPEADNDISETEEDKSS